MTNTFEAKTRQITTRSHGQTFKTFEGYVKVGEWSDIENSYIYFNHYSGVERTTKKDALTDAKNIINQEY